MFAFPAAGNERSTHGGVAVLIRRNVGGRLIHHHSTEGCGCVALAMGISGTDMLLVSLCLQCSIGLTLEPNGCILAELLALVKRWKGPWLMREIGMSMRAKSFQRERPKVWVLTYFIWERAEAAPTRLWPCLPPTCGNTLTPPCLGSSPQTTCCATV